MGGEWGRVFRNIYKGYIDKTKGGLESGEGGEDGWGGGRVVGGKCRQLYLNNNKKKKKRNLLPSRVESKDSKGQDFRIFSLRMKR